MLVEFIKRVESLKREIADASARNADAVTMGRFQGALEEAESLQAFYTNWKAGKIIEDKPGEVSNGS